MTKSNARTARPVVASDVRSFFRADDKRMARLTEAEQVSVREGARGALHSGVVRKFNSGRPEHRRYVSGQTLKVKEATAAQRQALADQGLAGKRGPLSAAALASLKG